MFYNDRSDFGAIVAGMFYVIFVALLYGIMQIVKGFDMNVDQAIYSDVGIQLTLTVIGLIIAGFTIYKGYLPEGITFGLVAASIPLQTDMVGGLIALILFIFVAVMCYLSGQLDTMALNILFGIGMFLTKSQQDQNTWVAVAGILMVLAACVALYICFMEWKNAQDCMDEIDSAMLDECECDCEECNCEDKKE